MLFRDPVFPVLIASWAGLVVLSLSLWCRRLNRVYRKGWYDLSEKGPNEEMEWQEIRELMEGDPAPDRLSGYRFPPKQIARDLIGVVVATIIFYASLTFIFDVNTWSDEFAKIGALAGVPALIIAVVTILYQVRLTSRTANRQEWINSIRSEIGVLIGSFPPPHASDRMVDDAVRKIREHLTKLELYLNPSERVHRGFLAVLRFMYGFSRTDVDAEAGSRLCIPQTRRTWRDGDGDSAMREWVEWQFKSMRLANVLLKREWEQVKRIK